MNMTSERQAYIYVQLPGTLATVPAALLRVEKLRDGTFVGRFRYGDRYLERRDAIAFDPFKLPLGNLVHEFTRRKGIPGAVRDAGPDAWGRRVIEHKLERSPGDLEEIDYLLNGPQDGAGCLSFGPNLEPPAPARRYNRTHQLAELVAAAEAIEEGRRVPVQITSQRREFVWSRKHERMTTSSSWRERGLARLNKSFFWASDSIR